MSMLASLNPAPAASWTMTSGFSWLVALRVLVPSLRVLRTTAVSDFFKIFLASQREDGDLAALTAAIEAAPVSAKSRNQTLTDLSYMLAIQAIPASDITPGSLIHFGLALREVSTARDKNTRKLAGALVWQVLVDAGKFPEGTPVTMRIATVGGRKSVAEMVGSYGVSNYGVRQLLIDYISHRGALGMDYSTLSHLVRALTRNFWCVIERINPNQDDLDLDETTYEAWRAEIDTVQTAEGSRPRQSIWDLLVTVRALYLDIQSWAIEDPARWGPWVARCPIPPIASRGYSADRRRQAERIADRTRTRQPLLELLVDHVMAVRDQMSALLAAAEASSGAEFEVNGVRYLRNEPAPRTATFPHGGPRSRRGAALEPAATDGPLRIQRADGGPSIEIHSQEARAFWTWAIIEVLRLTGVRHEELLELSHLSVRQYRRSNGEIVALLVVTPSKTDRERVIPMSPELLHVIAQVIRRQTDRLGAIPLVRRWDPHERQHTEPMPFLFQRSSGHTCGVMSPSAVARMIGRACQEAAEHHPQFKGLTFTPHDFRRLFATDLVNNGLPIHIGAALLGHASLQTTRGYVAVFDEEVVRHYQLHLTRRRQLRPKGEYRITPAEEWDEFEEHFDKRKVELGTCGRPYGTPCAHEHACVRCPMLHVEPQMVPRLDQIEKDLLARREQAEGQGWGGEIEGIEVTLDHLLAKRARALRLDPAGPVALPMPTLRKPGHLAP
ncbi:tyrosine-type recombinase/integrase [Streptomyces sp. L7]|uniref:tyrosine-type recombinase/integrase n=1 Tax=Streptomyces sp. L7 TaxID=3423954 RepID=UPI003D959534